MLLPVGAGIARLLKAIKPESAAWFYLHVSCQLGGYVVGVAGRGTRLKLGSSSQGITYAAHRNIGCVLFGLATLQVFALFLRPDKEHKYRCIWNAYHHSVGYTVIALGVFDVFEGLQILNPDPIWVNGYSYAICSLAVRRSRRLGNCKLGSQGHGGELQQVQRGLRRLWLCPSTILSLVTFLYN